MEKGKNDKEGKKKMTEMVATNAVASQLPEQQPTAMPSLRYWVSVSNLVRGYWLNNNHIER